MLYRFVTSPKEVILPYNLRASQEQTAVLTLLIETGCAKIDSLMMNQNVVRMKEGLTDVPLKLQLESDQKAAKKVTRILRNLEVSIEELGWKSILCIRF